MDIDNIWNFAVRLIWFATPIFYAIENQKRLFLLNLANPLYYFITVARDMVIYGKMPPSWVILGSVLFSLIFLTAGIMVFDKLKVKMGELL